MAQLAKDDRIVTPTSAEEEAALRADGYVDLVDYVFPPGDSLARHFSTGERAALRKELGGGGGGLTPAELAASPELRAAYASLNEAGELVVGGQVIDVGSGGPALTTDRFLPAVPVATKTNMLYNGLSNGTDTSTTYRNWVDVAVDCRDVRLVYANVYTSTALILDTPGTDPIKVKAALEITTGGLPSYPAGTLRPVYFGAEGRQAAMNPGSLLVSDPIPGEYLAGQGFYVNTFVSVETAGQKWPVGKWNDQGGTNSIDGTAPNHDATDGASSGGGVGLVGNNRAYSFMPVAIIGTPVDPTKRTVLVLGNSIPTGTANAGNITDGGAGGYPSRALKGKAGIINIAQPSEKAGEFLVADRRLARTRLIAGSCSDAFVDYANTTLFGDGNSSFATVTSALQKTFTFLADRGMRVHTATCTPRTTSSDGWTTTAGQTLHAQNGLRNQVNAWIRAMCPQDGAGVAVAPGTAGAVPNPHIVSVSELADAVETARDSGIWKNGLTGDGVHPNATGSAAMAAAVNTDAILTPALNGGGGTTVVGGITLWQGTQAEYDALTLIDPNVWYGVTP